MASKVLWAYGLLVTLLLTAGVVAVGNAATPVDDGEVVRTEENWQIVRAGNEYRVIVRLSQPIPVRSAHPRLLIDGKEYRARASSDRRTLMVPIPRDQVQVIRQVGIPGFDQGRSVRRRGVPARSFEPAAPRPVAGSRRLLETPAAPGPYQVKRADYDFGDEVLDIEGSDIKGELRAAVYLPKDAAGARPVVLFLHGMHYSCYDNSEADFNWPCAPGFQPKPSYLGYDAPAQALASHGYVVVSISANGVNIVTDGYGYNDFTSAVNEYTARGQLLLDHLDLLAEANEGRVATMSVLRGRLDLQRIGLMGHSRGGAGAARAVLMNAVRQQPYGIAAVLPLAATSEGLAIPDVPLASVFPYCDGDVYTGEGWDYVEKSRHAFPDNVLRSAVMMMGANHNFFNAMWSPGVPGGLDDADYLRGACAVDARLTPAQQYALGAAYISGFFRLTLGQEMKFLPMFDGTNPGLVGLPEADVRSIASFPATSRQDVQNFDIAEINAGAAGWPWTISALSEGQICEFSTSCDVFADTRFPQEGSFFWLRGRGIFPRPPGRLAFRAPASIDASGYRYLSFRLGEAPKTEPPIFGAGVSIFLGGQAGHALRRVPADTPALQPMPPIYDSSEERVVNTVVQQQILFPLDQFPSSIVNGVKTIALLFRGLGDVALSDVALVNPAVGEGFPSKLPSVRIGDMDVPPGNSERTVEVAVRLSRPTDRPVSMRAHIYGLPNSGISIIGNGLLDFSVGEQEKYVAFKIAAGTPSGSCRWKLTGIRNAFADRDLARVRVVGPGDEANLCGVPPE